VGLLVLLLVLALEPVGALLLLDLLEQHGDSTDPGSSFFKRANRISSFVNCMLMVESAK
jgi:hypothetical protein